MDNSIKFRWFGVCAFEFVINGNHLITDPYITLNKQNGLDYNVIENCDAILLSHTHFDHITDLTALTTKFNPYIFTGALSADAVAEYANSIPMKVYAMYPNLELDFDNYKIKSLYGRHTVFKDRRYDTWVSKIDEWEVTKLNKYPRFKELNLLGNIDYTNYIITANGKKIVFFGGNVRPEQVNIYKGENPDIAFIQYLKNDIDKIAYFAVKMGAKRVVPTHADYTASREEYLPGFLKLQEKLEANGIKMTEPLYNTWFEI